MSLSAFPGSGAPARLVSIGLPQGQGSGTIPLLYRRSGLLARNNFLSTLGILLCTRAASSFLAPAASRQLLQTRIASSRVRRPTLHALPAWLLSLTIPSARRQNLAAPTMIVVPAPSPLPDLGSGGFSISTFNVLLPNSIDGWWIYKYYQPHVPAGKKRGETSPESRRRLPLPPLFSLYYTFVRCITECRLSPLVRLIQDS